MDARMTKGGRFVEPGNVAFDEKRLHFVTLPYRSCSAQTSGRFMRNKRWAAPSVSPPPRGGGRRTAAALGALSRVRGLLIAVLALA